MQPDLTSPWLAAWLDGAAALASAATMSTLQNMISDRTRTRPARVRAVVVSWNGARLLPDCLDSLLAQTVADDLAVVVVDNASEDGTATMLSDLYPEVIVVRSESNLGFAGGADLGLAGFTGPFIALLNNDATFRVDAIEQMMTVLEQPGNERVGATASGRSPAICMRPARTAPARCSATTTLATHLWCLPDTHPHTLSLPLRRSWTPLTRSWSL